MYCCYYKCFQAHKIVKCLYVLCTYTAKAGFHIEFNGDAIMLGACPVKIMILEVRFLLTNFDLTSAIITLYFALLLLFFNFGEGEIWALEGEIPGLPPMYESLLSVLCT